MIIYLDVFIIQNLIVNFFLIYCTSQSVKINTKMIYIILSSVLGTLYAVAAVYTKAKFLFNIPIKLIIAFLMASIAFRKKNLLTAVKIAIIYIVYSMLLAGICLFIELNSNISTTLTLNKFSYKTLLSSIMVIYVFLHRLITYLKDRKDISCLIYDVDIIIEDEVNKVRAFLDTGNELREPATNLPVMIVEEQALPNLKIKSDEIFFIPYRVINGFNGKLTGFKPKYINIHKNSQIEKKEVVIAICNGVLSDLNDYNALLSRGIL